MLHVSNSSSSINILTDGHVPVITNLSPQGLDAFEINESAFSKSHYDVGDILKGNILVKISVTRNRLTMSLHVTPGNNCKSFIK